MDEKIKLLIKTFGEHRIKINEPLSYHVFSNLGGPAEIFFIAMSQKELKDILELSNTLKIPFFVLGSGTKTFVSSAGLKGLVVKNRTSVLKIGAVKGKVDRAGIGVEEAMVEADSGVSLGRLNDFLVAQNLQKIENVTSAATIGGSIWTTPALISVIQKVTVWEKGEVSELAVSELKRNDHIILSVVLKIKAST